MSRIAPRARVALPLLLVAGLVLAGVEAWNPTRIDWEPVALPGLEAWRAPGLVVQEERGGALFATRGYDVYRSREGGPFEKVHTVWPAPGAAWGGFSRSLRTRLRHHELVEVVPLSDDELVVFAAGTIQRVDLARGESETTHTLRYFGLGEGRGVMPHGIAVDDRGALYYGEYVTRPLEPGEGVRLYRSEDRGRSWQVAYEFSTGEVRHIHTVRWDPHAQRLWMTTGDARHEPKVGWSTDRGESFTFVGGGSQTWRTTSLVFDEAAVTWVMDSEREAHPVQWRRAEQEVHIAEARLPSPGYYVQALGPGRVLVGTGEQTVALYELAGGRLAKLAAWPVDHDPTRPNPTARLPRSPVSERWVYVSPLRTRAAGASLYRLARPLAPPR